MGWQVRKISSSKERAAEAVRAALDVAADSDKPKKGRGYGSVANAVEAAIQAFGNINGYSLEIATIGEISVDGKGSLQITMQTIDQDVIV